MKHRNIRVPLLFPLILSCILIFSACEQVGVNQSLNDQDQSYILPHTHTEATDPAIEPKSCSEPGSTEGTHCSVCGEILVEQKPVTIPHTKGDLIDVCANRVEGVDNPGLFECAVCHQCYYDTITADDIDIPVLSISGDLSGISKNDKKKVVATYSDDTQSFELNATLKLQGATSLVYPKKNFNIQFFKDDTYSSKQKVKLVDSWGKQNKYTLKANWIDFSEMRNVISGKLYGDVVRSRGIDDEFDQLANGGAIDGYPVLIFINGIYQGLYTLNTSKDDYLFDMKGKEDSREAILMVNDWGETGRLHEHIPEGFGPTWELEYASTEDDEEIGTDWVIESFNNMMDFVNENDGQDFIDGISKYINVPRAIDSMLYTWAIKGLDNGSKNILWVTYDGVQWMPSVYDMDGTWGMKWDGDLTAYGTAVWDDLEEIELWEENALWEKFYHNFYDELVKRWKELRQGPLSIENVDKVITDFYHSVPGMLYECERQRWSLVPSRETNHATQIVNWAIEYFQQMDAFFDITVDEVFAYRITVATDENTTVRAYLSTDYSRDPNQTSLAYSRDGDTGYLTTSNGQFNFMVVLPNDYEIDEISAVGHFEKLIAPADTGAENVYRITGISGDLNITITTAPK